MILRALVVVAALGVWAAFHYEWLPYRPVTTRIYVTFPHEVDVEVGAPVVYRGVPVGRVEAKGLRQAETAGPAQVQLTLAFDSEEVVLRRDDRFVVDGAGILGTPHVRVEVADDLSPPLPSGSRVAGVPDLSARVSEKAGEALRKMGESARETGQRVLDQLLGTPGNGDAAPSREGTASPKSAP